MTVSLRVARLGMLLFVLVFGATYTANLAAFFTKPNFRLIGPTTAEALAASHLSDLSAGPRAPGWRGDRGVARSFHHPTVRGGGTDRPSDPVSIIAPGDGTSGGEGARILCRLR